MEKEVLAKEIFGYYTVDSESPNGIWQDLEGLKIPIDKMFAKFALKEIVILKGSDVLSALEESRRETANFESFRYGYATPPAGIGELSILNLVSSEKILS